MHLVFLNDPSILEAKAEIIQKIVCFLGDLKPRKIASEINWPLIEYLGTFCKLLKKVLLNEWKKIYFSRVKYI